MRWRGSGSNIPRRVALEQESGQFDNTIAAGTSARAKTRAKSGCSHILSGASRALGDKRSVAHPSVDPRDLCRMFLFNGFGQAKTLRLRRYPEMIQVHIFIPASCRPFQSRPFQSCANERTFE
jgi:hypothetical protein